MHIILIAICLLFSSNSLAAEWIPIARYFDSNSKEVYFDGDAYFIDQDSIKFKGNMVRFWYLHDKKKKDEFGAKSYKGFLEMNCVEKELRFLSFLSFSDNMGKTVLSSDASQGMFMPIVPDSHGEIYHKIFCK